MSTNVISFGYIAPLLTAIEGDAEQQEFRERLYEETSLQANYDCTLVYMDFGENEEYFGGFTLLNEDHLTRFHEELNKQGIEITHEVKPFFSVWYNGTDSYCDTLKLEAFINGEYSDG